MKSKLLKSSLFFLTFITLFFSVTLSASAAEGYVKSGDFTYYVSGSYATVTAYNGKSTSVTIPSKVGSYTVIGVADKAFWSKKDIKSVSFPSTVQSIGKAAFNECTGLTKLVLPSNLKLIGESAFWYCTSLKAIYIPPSVTSIATNSFTGCKNLTAYVIPSSYAEAYVKSSGTVKLGYRYATSVKLPAASASIDYGSSVKLSYAVYPTNAYNKKVTFSSSDTSVLKISSTGIITPVKCGSAIVMVTTADGSKKSAKILLHVVPAKIDAPVQSASALDGYTISWNKSAGATAYGVYKYNQSTKKWELVKKTTSRSYSLTGLPAGTLDYYRILPYTTVNGKTYPGKASDYAKAYVLSPGKVSDVTFTSNSNTIKLSWSAAPNASGYQIYSFNESTGSYTYLGKTQNLSATLKKLKSNTRYVYAIRSYLLHEGKMIVSKEIVDNIVACTKPDKVTGFGVDPSSVTTSSVRLVWNKLKGVSGYEIFSYDEASVPKYTLVATLTGDSVTGYTIDGLKSGQTKKYCIRGYISADTVLYGSASEIITIKSAELPESRNEAFTGFTDALNASKNSSEDFYLIKTQEVSNLNGSYSEACKDILNSIAHTNVSKYYFENGIDNNTSLPVGSYIQPYNVDTKLKLTDVKSFEYSLDGSGYRISLTLGEESNPAPVNSQIAPVIDWGVVAGQHKGFSIKYCLYEGTTVNAKVNNGRIDEMEIILPINFAFTYNGTEYAFTQTITHNYIFGW